MTWVMFYTLDEEGHKVCEGVVRMITDHEPTANFVFAAQQLGYMVASFHIEESPFTAGEELNGLSIANEVAAIMGVMG